MTEIKESIFIEPRKADAGYRPFPTFSEWMRKCEIDTVRWNRYSARLEKIKESSNIDITRVREAIELAAAIDTGAIEGLYDTDRGFTYTVAFESAVWQSVVEKIKGEKVRALIESQLSAFEYVLDFATKNVAITSAWIRELHREICKEQETFQAVTEIGIQKLSLPKGEYKHLPNHVLKQNDSIHSYAPVDLTSFEMIRLCDELNSEAFQSAHPVIQSAYSHYAFVVIHPFADGNGRVARALASVYTYRSLSIPLLIFADNRGNYRSALEEADEGNYQAFVDFILDVGLSSIQLFSETIETNTEPRIEDSVEKISGLFITKGGYTHNEVDEAGYRLVEMFTQEFTSEMASMSLPRTITSRISKSRGLNSVSSSSYRNPTLDGNGLIQFNLSTDPPASAVVNYQYNLEVPKDCGRSDDIILRDKEHEQIFEARASELIPNPTAALQMRIRLAVKKIIRNALTELYNKANKSLRE